MHVVPRAGPLLSKPGYVLTTRDIAKQGEIIIERKAPTLKPHKSLARSLVTAMPMLPAVRLKHEVGLTTFSAPVQPQTFGTAKLPGGEPAVHLEEVLFNVFYPCDEVAPDKTSFVPWLTR